MPEWVFSHGMWNSIFVVGAPLAEKVLRPILTYIFLVIALRVFGKRELAQLNPFDLVVLLSLSNTVQNAIIGNDNSWSGGVVGALALLAMNYLVVRFLFRHRRLDQVFEGQPRVLVENGHVREKALAAELLTHSELTTALHRQGFDSLHEVDRCVLEPGGTFFIQRKMPSEKDIRHEEVIDQLKQISGKLDMLMQPPGSRV